MITWKNIILAVFLLGAIISCRQEPAAERKKIEKITFEEQIKNIFIGDTVKVNIEVNPAEAKETGKIEFSTTEDGIVDIKEESGNDGVVFQGLKRGTTVITAKADGVVDYCSVTVLGASENIIPHIIVPYYVMECRENERRSIVASLAGGTPLDDSGFVWSYTGQKTINLESVGNVGVFDTVSVGTSVVTVSHPKAQFSVDVLVYVIGNDEIPVYITTDNNVINLKTNDRNYQYAVELRGGDGDDYSNFRHELINGGDIIDLNVNNNIGTINALTKGIARIKVSHPKSVFPIEIVIIVNEEFDYRYIDVDKTLIIMEEGQNALINAQLMGDAPSDYPEKYGFVNPNGSVARVEQSQGQFMVYALQKGSSIIKISNNYADFEREVLVIVNGIESIKDNEIYISTNQNVITAEAGDDKILLTMTLTGGGNEADPNQFVWTVDDGTVINVTSAHGDVNYKNRAAVSNTGSKFEAQALIKALKVGTARITLEHPKARNNFSVLVKVYKKGVFDIVPVVIDGPKVFAVKTGEQLPVSLWVAAGNEQYLANVVWNDDGRGIISASGSGLTGLLEGQNHGIATVTVSADNAKHDYQATVIVGNDDQLRETPYIYVMNPFMSVVKGETVAFKIICQNMTAEEISAINVINNSNDIIEVLSYRENVTVMGLELGEGEIVISGPGINTVRIMIMVEEYNINPDMPYYLRTNSYIYGVVKNRNIEIEVGLVGGSASNEGNIIWKTEDPNVALIAGSGKRCMITGRNTGQTVINVSHAKSHNELDIVIYTVEDDSELTDKVIIHVKDKNILLEKGESKYISVITNATSAQQNGFQWSFSNANVINVIPGADRGKAYITAVGTGSDVITVRCGIQSTAIYVSVINKAYHEAYIGVPSIVEMIAGETISINAVIKNIYDDYNIKWESRDSDIAMIYENGGSCLVNALKSGNTVITVEYKKEGYIKDIILYVYNSIEEMAASYVMAGEQTRYIINRGDIINISLVFGKKGYPDYEMHNIRWNTADSTVIELIGNGRTAAVKGINVGIALVTVSSNIANPIVLEIEVREAGKTGEYWFNIREQDRIKGIIAGKSADVIVEIFNGGNKVHNISGIEYIVEKSEIISVAANGDGMHITAAAEREGQSYITMRHDLAGEAKILVYTAAGNFGLENAYPVFVEKSNYLLNKGDTVTINVITKDNDSGKLANIAYGLERYNNTVSIQEKNKREIAVRAENAGNDVILIRYNGQVVQRVYVSVSEGVYGQSAGYMVTENIIGLLCREEYEIKVETDAPTVSWRKQSDHVADIVRTQNKTAVVRGNLPGKTVIVVSSGNVERNVAVFVCETENELRNYNAINIEQRHYRIKKNENVNIKIHSYQGMVEGNTRYADYYDYDVPYGNVIEVNAAENDRFSVRGVNEGAAAIRVTNEYYNTEIIVYIEVEGAGSGGTQVISGGHFITAEKTLYVIGPEERNVLITVNVAGSNFFGDSFWVWSGYNGGIISVNGNGREAVINPLCEGQTKIRVSNKDCANTLDITIIVGERFTADNSLLPYIYMEKNVYEIMKDSANIQMAYSIVNVINVDNNDISYKVYGNSAVFTHNANEHFFAVSARETGITRIVITYGELQREAYILVKENLNIDNIYLTTSENYVNVSIGELRTVNIKLAGYDELSAGNFAWSVEPNNGVISLVGNGETGQIFGVGEGSAVITVRHPKAEPYPIKINVKVTKDKVKENVIYLTTQRNVIEMVAGTAAEQIYVQKIGGNILTTQTTWTVSDASIIDLNGQDYTAQFTAKKEGVARIQVKNIESNYILEIVVIVRASLNNNIYIDTTESLLLMSPGEAQRRISVVLANGDPKDNILFRWSIDSQIPSDVNKAVPGIKVINIVGSNQECFINTVNEGIAQIRVTNEKAERALIITVYVTQYKELKFSVNQKEIVINENEFVGINLPNYEYLGNKVRVWVEKTDGSSGSDICDVYYSNELVLLSGKKRGVVIVKANIEGKEGEAQLYVNVVEQNNPNVNRIVVGKSVYVLNLKSTSVMLNALVSGPKIFDPDNDNIQWIINKTGVIDVIPKNDAVVNARGRQVQITPHGLGTATILIKHNYVTEEYWKEISVIVAETNSTFSVSRTDINVNSSRPETVTADIVGGTSRDYAEIKWIARMQQKWDGTMLEIVRIMGSGREVVLYPINDGITEVLAVYGKDTIIIKVEVISDYYFNFRNSNEFMYPGEIRELPYDIRPANSTPNWIQGGLDDDDPVITYGDVAGSKPNGNGSVERLVRVEALREGTATIIGMANGKMAQTNIVVQYDYMFRTAANLVAGHPKYYGMVNGKLVNESGVTEIEYTLYPPNTYIKPVGGSINGLNIEIETPVVKNDGSGTLGEPGIGKIRFTGSRELAETVTFQQYKAKRYNNNGDVPIAGSERTVNVLYTFNFSASDQMPEPYFIRGDGLYSNSSVVNGVPQKGAQYTLKNGNSPANAEKIKKTGNEYELDLGDGEEHYILFDKLYNTAEMDIDRLEGGGMTQISINGQDVNFTVELVDVVNEGISRKALRLSGGTDYQIYNRVQFDKSLFLHVNSDFCASSEVQAVTERLPAWNDMVNISYPVVKKKYSGPWQSYVKDTTKPSKRFYLLRDADLNEFDALTYEYAMNIFNPVAITEESKLLEYYEDYRHTYCYSLDSYSGGSGESMMRFTNFLLFYCDLVEVYPFVYTYGWQAYLTHRNIFDNGAAGEVDKAHLVYADNTVIGGYITSSLQVGGVLQSSSATQYYTIYVYNRAYLSSLGISVDKGGFNDNLQDPHNHIQYMGNYNITNNIYSTNTRYTDAITDYIGGASETSIYDVFRDYYVGSNHQKINNGNPYGVYILMNKTSEVAAAYGRRALSFVQESYGSWEYVNYGGMQSNSYLGSVSYLTNFIGIMRHDQNGRMKNLNNNPPANFISRAAINGDVESFSVIGGTTRTEINTNPGEHNNWGSKTYYSYSCFPNNTTVYSGMSVSGQLGCKENGLPLTGYTSNNGNIPTPGNTQGGYILNGNVWYYMTYESFYSRARARQWVEWQNIGHKVIVPYYALNRFPFRYETINSNPNIKTRQSVLDRQNSTGTYYKTVESSFGDPKQYVKISEGGGKPMLSINNTDIINRNQKKITVKCIVFDPNSPTGRSERDLVIKVNLMPRQCSMMYAGGGRSDAGVNPVGTNEGWDEIEGGMTGKGFDLSGDNAKYFPPDIDRYL